MGGPEGTAAGLRQGSTESYLTMHDKCMVSKSDLRPARSVSLKGALQHGLPGNISRIEAHCFSQMAEALVPFSRLVQKAKAQVKLRPGPCWFGVNYG